MIESGCVYGRPGVGGRPRQCKRLVTQPITILPDDTLIVESAPLCDEHATDLALRLEGTIYRENADGPLAVRMVPG